MSTDRILYPVLAIITLLAIAVPALVVHIAPPSPIARHTATPPQRVVPAAEVPPVEPVEFVALAPDDARTFNATVPFVTGPNPAARPFRFVGSDADRARATDCLAAAVLYEAGDDAVGEKAVAQVVLNRLRHPAYPKTICGVVFEGATRRTGCQFSFACDGSLARTPSPAGWSRASRIAAAALGGAVFAPVGWSTHYHADWIVPYWAASLDKVATVGAHIFYRWRGGWGEARAFRGRYAGGEPALGSLVALTRPSAPEQDTPIAPPAGAMVATPDRPVLPVRQTEPQAKAPIVGLDERRILPLENGPK